MSDTDLKEMVSGGSLIKKVLCLLCILSGIIMVTGCEKVESAVNVSGASVSESGAVSMPVNIEHDSLTAVEETDTSSVHETEQKRESAEVWKSEDTDMERKMKVQVGDYSFTATLTENAAVKELIAMMKENPVVLQMEEYSGFEKVGPLGKSLTRSDKQTITEKGDIVLYSGSNIVLFYGSNSWSYTMLGRIDDLTDWEKALGSGSVTVTFSME